MNTIFAVSSGRPPAAIAVIRISGARAAQTLAALVREMPVPRHATIRRLHDADGMLLDEALVLWFPGPHTATGEDLAELHVHGGRAVVAAVERALGASSGLRQAEPGEFTRRALENGRIDLAQAEGLADLLEAETEAQRRAAVSSASGRLSAIITRWLSTLADIAADVEAALDFSDEDDVPAVDQKAIRARLEAWLAELHPILEQPTVEEIRDGARIVIAGPPNAGKSSLFNAMIGREAAIVTSIAGTTRDTIEARVVRQGRSVTLVDTAGLNTTSVDPVEMIGIERAAEEIATADLVLWLDDDAEPPANAIHIHPRCDEEARGTAPSGRVAVSPRDPGSTRALWACIDSKLALQPLDPDETILRRTQYIAIVAARDAIVDEVESRDLLVTADAIRYASAQLGEVLGLQATELMLDSIFARFCIGK